MALNLEKETLNARDKRFCEEYVANGYNASKAYLVTHDVAQSTAGNSGYRLLKKASIQNYIRELEKDIFTNNHINAEHIANELATMAFREITKEDSLSYNDKIKALELLGKQLSLYTQKVDMAGSADININIVGEENGTES